MSIIFYVANSKYYISIVDLYSSDNGNNGSFFYFTLEHYTSVILIILNIK